MISIEREAAVPCLQKLPQEKARFDVVDGNWCRMMIQSSYVKVVLMVSTTKLGCILPHSPIAPASNNVFHGGHEVKGSLVLYMVMVTTVLYCTPMAPTLTAFHILIADSEDASTIGNMGKKAAQVEHVNVKRKKENKKLVHVAHAYDLNSEQSPHSTRNDLYNTCAV